MTERFAGPFLAMFEALRMNAVFARGRRDERAGHVRHLSVSGSLLTARVRGGEDDTAYRARVAARAFGAAEWARVEDALAAQARFAGGLLAGRMPDGVEQVFDRAGLSLLPLSIAEVVTDCTCGRPMPCTHVAAAVYAAARLFDTDPFQVFAWRGRTRDELLTRLRQLRGTAGQGTAGAAGGGVGGTADRSAAGRAAAGSADLAATSGAADLAAVSAADRSPPPPDKSDFWGEMPKYRVQGAGVRSAGMAAPSGGPTDLGLPGGGPRDFGPPGGGPRDLGPPGGGLRNLGPPGGTGRADAILDEDDVPGVSVGGVPLADVLRGAYQAMGR